MTPGEPLQLHSLLGSIRRPVLVENRHAEFFLDGEVLLDDALFALTFFARLAAAALGAELADAHVESGPMNHAALVLVLTLFCALGAGLPLAPTELDQIGRAVLASCGSDVDGLLSVIHRFAEEDQAAGREVASVADAANRVLVVFGRADQLQLRAARELPLDDSKVGIDLFLHDLGFSACMEKDGAEVLAFRVCTPTAVLELFFRLHPRCNCSDRFGLFVRRRNQGEDSFLGVDQDLHSKPPSQFWLWVRHNRVSGSVDSTIY